MESLIKLDKISKSYGSKNIFTDFSFEVGKNEKILIMGPSGAGKSTLLNILGTLEKVDQGETVHFSNKNIRPQSKKSIILLREKISYLFQNYALIDNETVEKNLKLALKFSKDKDKEKIIEESLEKVGLKGYKDRMVYSLSGGEQQRVSLARLLIKPSEIILADEPTGNLDYENAQVVMNILEELYLQGKSLVMVSHDMRSAKNFDRVIKLEQKGK
ncbi:ATP-binding cassette domain-containing protein [Anaerococcus sp. Marseille-P3625]|uniref:ATP-binding cassette domain-containing protein n=1 Tax=Anaerococcus sp. Marseille-P3625 TaxID=1977277 RepID=UPI000C08BBE2|nr:ATP-binding cassette domain-containing protein [Anaerococcus sp. Marseille-P3625]